MKSIQTLGVIVLLVSPYDGVGIATAIQKVDDGHSESVESVDGGPTSSIASASSATLDKDRERVLDAARLLQEGDIGRAVDVLRSISDENMDAFTLAMLGRLEIRLGDRAKGMLTLNRAAERQPQSGLPFVFLGDCYRAVGKYDEARICYRKAMKISPDQSRAYVGLLKVDRLTNRRDSKDGPELCSRVFALEDAESSQFREALAYWNWLSSQGTTSSPPSKVDARHAEP